MLDTFGFKFVALSATGAIGVFTLVTLDETGWDWVNVELGKPTAINQFAFEINGNTWRTFQDTSSSAHVRSLWFLTDATKTISVKVAQLTGAATTGFIVNVARGYPIKPIVST